ncbi:universal stress protein [Devosia aquimaris]|uniref:universal stress protein n=1 Tax=Devosia aquimaris TaxID=2866214 RepID=UPI001CD068F8|nr:universal stress protein [Devosia sp. CJK-A8-3]
MDIRNIVVGLNVEMDQPELLSLAVDLATQHKATLTGFSSAQPPVTTTVGAGDVAGALYVEQMQVIEQGVARAKEHFLAAVPDTIAHKWVGGVQWPANGLIDLARTTDLIVLGASENKGQDAASAIDIGEVLLGAGRPVLIAAEGAGKVVGDKIVVAWKDTKEARRAIVDALPFLKAASDVQVLVIDEGNLASERASMQDAVAWLQSHDVKARGDVLPNEGGVAETIAKAAKDAGADLVVSGAYGHSRLRQWLVGGMTRGLLGTNGIHRLLSN